MKWLAIILSIFLVVGCATRLIVVETDLKGKVTRTIEAEDYSIKTPTLTAVPSRWLTPNFVAEFFKGIIGIIPAVIPTPVPVPLPTPAPAPVPTPTPTPTPTPYPAPEPTPIPVPSPVPAASTVFTQTGNLITLDMNTLTGSMRGAGFDGSDGALFYFAATVYRYGPGVGLVDVPDLAALQGKQGQFYAWFDAEVMKVVATMKANPSLTFTAITSDGKSPDKLGFRIGPPMMERLMNSGIAPSRVTLGDVLPESAYGVKK